MYVTCTGDEFPACNEPDDDPGIVHSHMTTLPTILDYTGYDMDCQTEGALNYSNADTGAPPLSPKSHKEADNRRVSQVSTNVF